MGFLSYIYNEIRSILPNFSITDASGKFAFIGLIVLILFFLIKPKPLQRMIPSLMFLLGRRKKGKIFSFLRKLIQDPLKVIQFFIVLFLCFAALAPIYNFIDNIANDRTILVLDSSASTVNSFSKVKKAALDNINGKVSIILIKDTPELIAKDLNKKEAISKINTLKPGYFGSDIASSLLIAEKIQNNSGKIVAISDFIDSNNQDTSNILQLMKAKNKSLKLVKLDSIDNTLGFINYKLSSKLTLYLKNYQDFPVNASVYQKYNDKVEYIGDYVLQANSIENIEVEPTKGIHEFYIENDNFEVDDRLFINIPYRAIPKIAVITNDFSGNFKNYLEASKYNIDIITPPIIPKTDYDLMIIYNINPQLYISSINDAIDAYLRRGKYLFIYGKPKDSRIEKYLPFYFSEDVEKEATISIHNVSIVNDLIVFNLNKYSKTIQKNNSVILNKIASIDNSTLISISQHKNGRVLYYGINDANSDLKSTIDYPLLLDRLLKYITKYEEFDDLNMQIGDTITGSEIVLNNQIIGYNEIIVSQPGLYYSDNKTIAVNYLNEKESTVPKSDSLESFNLHNAVADINPSLEVNKSLSLTLIFLSLALILILFEVFYIKYRGDI